MALLDIVERNLPASLLTIGVAVVALPIAAPALRPILVPLIRSGAKLFIESEWAADGAMADKLVDATIGLLSNVIARPAATEEERHEGIAAVMRRFDQDARAHADRWGSEKTDKIARYRRRVARLRRALAERRDKAAGDHRATWDRASDLVLEDW